MHLCTLLGLALTAVACLCIYAASPHQRLFAMPWPPRPARWLAALLLLSGWLAFDQNMQRLTSTFVSLTTVMLVLAVLPYLGALRHGRHFR